MLTIIVFPKKIKIHTKDGWQMRGFALGAHEKDTCGEFHKRTDYSSVNDVSICLTFPRLRFFTLYLKLTPEIKKAILNFLHHYHAKDNMGFDCYRFAGTMWGIESDNRLSIREVWDIRKRRWLPRVGDTLLFLGGGGRRFLHAAVYIGWGLYVSVYGCGGDLEISTLRDMKKDYGASTVVRVTPKRDGYTS